MTTNVRQDAPWILAASAHPTATGKPCPSGPVLVSTPGTFLRSGCPLSIDSGAMKELSSFAGEEAAVRQRRVQRCGAVALAQDEPIPVRAIRVLGVDVEHRAEQRDEDVRDREVAADVAELGRVDHRDDVAPHCGCAVAKRGQLLFAGRALHGLARLGVGDRSARLGYEHDPACLMSLTPRIALPVS